MGGGAAAVPAVVRGSDYRGRCLGRYRVGPRRSPQDYRAPVMFGPRSLESVAAAESSLAAGVFGGRAVVSDERPASYAWATTWVDAATFVDQSAARQRLLTWTARCDRSAVRFVGFSRYRWIDPAGTPWPRSSLGCAALTSFPTRLGVLRRSRRQTTGSSNAGSFVRTTDARRPSEVVDPSGGVHLGPELRLVVRRRCAVVILRARTVGAASAPPRREPLPSSLRCSHVEPPAGCDRPYTLSASLGAWHLATGSYGSGDGRDPTRRHRQPAANYSHAVASKSAAR